MAVTASRDSQAKGLGPEGNLVNKPDNGIAVVQIKYDENGDFLEKRYYDADMVLSVVSYEDSSDAR